MDKAITAITPLCQSGRRESKRTRISAGGLLATHEARDGTGSIQTTTAGRTNWAMAAYVPLPAITPATTWGRCCRWSQAAGAWDIKEERYTCRRGSRVGGDNKGNRRRDARPRDNATHSRCETTGQGRSCHEQSAPRGNRATRKACSGGGVPWRKRATGKACHGKSVPRQKRATGKACHGKSVPR